MIEFADNGPSTPEDAEPDWKRALRERFEEWLANLDEPPAEGDFEEHPPVPDLYTFHSDLSALASEFRKSNRRTAEAMKQWSELMGGFQNEIARLTRTLDETPNDRPVPASHWTDLIEFADRFTRVEAAFDKTPAPAWLNRDREWRANWQRQCDAFAILAGHLRDLLHRAGVTRVEALGQPLDVETMRVVDTTHANDHQPETVVQEIRPGYLRHDQVIRLAEVTVAIDPKP